MPFSRLGLSDPIVRAVAELGYTEPTPIQLQAIPAVLSGGDLLAGAQTGTGKTAAFALPLLQRMMKHENASTSPARHPVRALVLLPTRELAVQVAEQVKLYAKYTNLTSAVVFGGMEAALTPLMVAIEAAHPGVKVFSLPSVDHPQYGRHIELGVKGAPDAVSLAYPALLAGLHPFNLQFGPELVR